MTETRPGQGASSGGQAPAGEPKAEDDIGLPGMDGYAPSIEKLERILAELPATEPTGEW